VDLRLLGGKGRALPSGRNPYFILEPGYVLVLRDRDKVLTIRVKGETKKVDGVVCRVVEEKETEGDKVVELSNNYCALGKRTNSVYYFGEDKGGAWLSGEKGAKFGLLMPGLPLVGASSRTRHWRFPTGRSSSAPSAASGASARRG
jgi:hypothetical protein